MFGELMFAELMFGELVFVIYILYITTRINGETPTNV